jgi:hypothetical protein
MVSVPCLIVKYRVLSEVCEGTGLVEVLSTGSILRYRSLLGLDPLSTWVLLRRPSGSAAPPVNF